MEMEKVFDYQSLFLSINEFRCVMDRWRMDYNRYQPHSSLDDMSPAAFVISCLEQGTGTLCLLRDKEKYCDILS